MRDIKAGVVQRGSFPLVGVAEGQADSYAVRISTEAPVRAGGGIALAAGCDASAYLRNPVVMWAHDYKSPPIGRCLSLNATPGTGIDARFEFAPWGANPLADTAHRLWDGGFLNAASIGFLPDVLSIEWVDDASAPFGETPIFHKWELVEFSIVPIPMDREALRHALGLVVDADTDADKTAYVPRSGVADPHSGVVDKLTAEVSALDYGRVLEFLKLARSAVVGLGR